MEIPETLRYTEDHEWALAEGTSVRVGITDFAQEALGDIVFVQLPEVGSGVEQGATLGEIESTKSVSEVYAPLTGTVIEVNPQLVQAPELLNSEPYGGGWICLIEVSDPAALDKLLDARAYGELTASLG